MSAVGLLALALAVAGPLLVLLIASVARGWFFPEVLPPRWTLAAWRDLLAEDGALIPALVNSLGLAIACALVSLGLGLPAARALAELRGRRSSLVEGTLAVLPVLPPVLLGTGTHYFFLVIGLAGTLPAVLLAHLMISLPYATLVLLGGVRSVDPRFEAVAATLGASPARRALLVRVRLLWPSILLVLLFSFLISWGQYAITLVVGGGRVETLPTLVLGYVRGGNDAYAGVAGSILALPALFAAPWIGREFARLAPRSW